MRPRLQRNQVFQCLTFLWWVGVIIQSNTNGAAVMTVVLTNDGSGAKLPKASVVITAHRDKISRVGTKGAVPDPALVDVKN